MSPDGREVNPIKTTLPDNGQEHDWSFILRLSNLHILELTRLAKCVEYLLLIRPNAAEAGVSER